MVTQEGRTFSSEDYDRSPAEMYTCDNCLGLILGSRYSCGMCESFDLCVGCFKSNQPVCEHGRRQFTLHKEPEEGQDFEA